MSYLREALAIALESENSDEFGTAPVENLDEAVQDVEETAVEAEESGEVLDELLEAADSVESICTALEAHIADGGMTPLAAMTHNVAMENLLRRLPVDSSQFTVSHESFGGTQERLVASQEALEGAKALLGKIVSGIKNAVTKSVTAVVNFFSTIGKSGRAITAAARILKSKAAEARRQATPGKETIKVSGVAKKLHMDGKFDGNIDKGLKGVLDFLNTVVASTNVGAKMMAEAAVKINAKKFDDIIDIEEMTAAVVKPIYQRPLPGGKIVRFDQGKLVFASTSSFNGPAEVKLPEVSTIEAAADKMAKIGEVLSEFDKKHIKKLEAEMARVVNGIDAAIGSANSGLEKSERKNMESQMRELGRAFNRSYGIAPEAVRYAATAAKSAFGFGKAVLKKYGVHVEAPAGMDMGGSDE